MLHSVQVGTEFKNESSKTCDDTDVCRQIRLHESGEATLVPDRVRTMLSICATKETPEAAKQSVARRLDYICQTLRNEGVKDYDVHNATKIDSLNMFVVTSEITIDFHGPASYERTTNFLVEKLGTSVSVSAAPAFYHSKGKLADLRRQASLNAVHNCRAKALSIVQLLNQTLGAPILVEEVDVIETKGEGLNMASSDSIQSLIEKNTVVVRVRINAVFECEERSKKRSLLT